MFGSSFKLMVLLILSCSPNLTLLVRCVDTSPTDLSCIVEHEQIGSLPEELKPFIFEVCYHHLLHRLMSRVAHKSVHWNAYRT